VRPFPLMPDQSVNALTDRYRPAMLEMTSPGFSRSIRQFIGKTSCAIAASRVAA
jgi:hypothetical protein